MTSGYRDPEVKNIFVNISAKTKIFFGNILGCCSRAQVLSIHAKTRVQKSHATVLLMLGVWLSLKLLPGISEPDSLNVIIIGTLYNRPIPFTPLEVCGGCTTLQPPLFTPLEVCVGCTTLYPSMITLQGSADIASIRIPDMSSRGSIHTYIHSHYHPYPLNQYIYICMTQPID